MLLLVLYALFFPRNEHVKLGACILHGVLYLLKQGVTIWSEIWGCVLYKGAYSSKGNYGTQKSDI